MTRTLPLHYDNEPDDTPTGHTYAAAWWAMTGFAALDTLLVFQWAAMNHFFG